MISDGTVILNNDHYQNMTIAKYFCVQKIDLKIICLDANHNGYHLTIIVLYVHLHRTQTPKYIREYQVLI